MHFITNHIALGGSICYRKEWEAVQAAGITHIINLDRTCDLRWGDESVEILHYYLPDDGAPKPSRYFLAPVVFAVDVLRDPNNKLLIHCAYGYNRAPSIVATLLMFIGYPEEEVEALISRYGELDKKGGNIRYTPGENLFALYWLQFNRAPYIKLIYERNQPII